MRPWNPDLINSQSSIHVPGLVAVNGYRIRVPG